MTTGSDVIAIVVAPSVVYKLYKCAYMYVPAQLRVTKSLSVTNP